MAQSNAVATNNAIARIKPQDGSVLPIGELMERIIAAGDISHLQPGDRAHYLVRVAESAGLNPLSQPFDLIPGQGGKLVLYANKKASDQLRKIYGLTSHIISRETVEGVYVVEVEVSDGVRTETNIGAVPIKNLQGEALANALMKAFTKAKRRATLDYAGLGVLDETEVEGMRAAMQEQERSERPSLNVVVATDPQPAPAVNLNDDIKRLREVIGWSAQDVIGMAKEKGWNPRTQEGLQAIHDCLQEYVDNAFGDSDDDPATDTEIIEAEYQPAMPGMPAQDRWTDG